MTDPVIVPREQIEQALALNAEVKAIAYVMARSAVKEMGYPSLTEALEDLDRLRAQPEAPKVEQEPVGYADPRVLAGMKSGKYADVTIYPTCGTASSAALYTHPAPSSGELPTSIRDIAAERRRQIEIEGRSAGFDDGYTDGELAVAGACYGLLGSGKWAVDAVREIWPKSWGRSWLKSKPADPRRDLVKAGALIAAEIDRLDRIAQHKGPQS